MESVLSQSVFLIDSIQFWCLYATMFGIIASIIGFLMILMKYNEYKTDSSRLFLSNCNYSIVANNKFIYVEYFAALIVMLFTIVWEYIFTFVFCDSKDISITKMFKYLLQNDFEQRNIIVSIILLFHLIPMVFICFVSFGRVWFGLLLFSLPLVLVVYIISLLLNASAINATQAKRIESFLNQFKRFYSIFSFVWIITVFCSLFYESNVYSHQSGLYIEMFAICWFVWIINMGANQTQTDRHKKGLKVNQFYRIFYFCFMICVLLIIVPIYNYIFGNRSIFWFDDSSVWWQFAILQFLLWLTGIALFVACVRSVHYLKQHSDKLSLFFFLSYFCLFHRYDQYLHCYRKTLLAILKHRNHAILSLQFHLV